MKKKVLIAGLGYVGLPLLFQVSRNKSYKVLGFDIDKDKISLIRSGEVILKYKELHLDRKKLKKIYVTSDIKVFSKADIIVVCVPTPIKDDFEPDLGSIKKVSNFISNNLRKSQVIIIESTINPGVCEEVILPILERSGLKGGKDFMLAHCPERVSPGDLRWNVGNIPRNVGALTKKGSRLVANFYRSIISAPISEIGSLKEAEATKILENTFRDINIAFINELAKSFDKLGIDIIEVIKGASTKPFAFIPHYPGCGVGGHCIPVDPYYLIERAKKAGFTHKFLLMAREINNSMPDYTVNLLSEELNKLKKAINGTKIGLLGLSYKGGVGDIRESPGIKIKKILEEKGAILEIYDPFLLEMSSVGSIVDLLRKVDVLLISTDHKEFRKLDSKLFVKYGIILIIDGRNCLDKKKIISLGIPYKGIGI